MILAQLSILGPLASPHLQGGSWDQPVWRKGARGGLLPLGTNPMNQPFGHTGLAVSRLIIYSLAALRKRCRRSYEHNIWLQGIGIFWIIVLYFSVGDLPASFCCAVTVLPVICRSFNPMGPQTLLYVEQNLFFLFLTEHPFSEAELWMTLKMMLRCHSCQQLAVCLRMVHYLGFLTAVFFLQMLNYEVQETTWMRQNENA